VDFPGRAEMLQALAAAPGARRLPVRMMLANDELRVVLVTIHLSLRRAIDALSVEAVLPRPCASPTRPCAPGVPADRASPWPD
jgi:4-hydroxythreonine-4-phosphate dehydrogenase